MKKCLVLAVVIVLFGCVGEAPALWRKTSTELIDTNKKLHGKILDYTANHGCDNRFWSRSLGQRRDMYIYLPPNFDPHERYPILILLHGLGQDEQIMFPFAPYIDKAIYVGDLPPMIVAVPDGTVSGEPSTAHPGTFFINSNLGDFEDYVLNDVWGFVATHFPIRSEREAHILAGVSMGGFGAFSMAIRNRYCFGVCIGLYPPLNLRWMDDCGDYMAKFNPYHWGWRTNFDRPGEVIGRFGLQTVRVSQLVKPLFTSPDEALVEISRLNPIELVERTCLRNDQLQMYIAYGARDEFNIDAQVESFLYLCKFRRINVSVGYDPEGHHNLRTAYRLWPGMVAWLGPRLKTKEIPVNCVCPSVCPGVTTNVAKKVAPLEPSAPLNNNKPQPRNTIWAPRHAEPGKVPATSQDAKTLPGENGKDADQRSLSSNEVSSERPPVRPVPPPASSQDLGPSPDAPARYGPFDRPSEITAPPP